jgi:TonB family protein
LEESSVTKWVVLTALLLLGLSASANSQAEHNTAPILWERYKISEKQLSIEFPKMPVVIVRGVGCSDSEKTSYFAYAAEAAYELTIVSKPKQRNQVNCKNVKTFNEGLLTSRLAEIRSQGGFDEASGFEDGRQVYRFSGKTGTRWLYSDIKNNRWIEVAVARREDVESKDQRFFGSLKFTADRGQEIGIGAETTLGDEGVELTPNPLTVQDPNKDRINVVARPLAMYTDQARKANVQGTVVLRIEFLANGCIGNIEVIKGLPEGLTENAVAAAKKVVFLPTRVRGKKVNTTLTLQYGFSIY